MRLYKNAGARYFVSMGSHHDNFYLWDSKLHPWNSVNMGPKRDVVGDWQKAAKQHGLKFGVSEHLGASFTWFQTSHGADKDGPKKGVPYDGANPMGSIRSSRPHRHAWSRRAGARSMITAKSHVISAQATAQRLVPLADGEFACLCPQVTVHPAALECPGWPP